MNSSERLSAAYEVTKSREDKTTFYDSWSGQYDKDVLAHDYFGPDIIADAVAAIYPTNRDKILILDVAAGTGLVGAKLAEKGFTKLDALDPSQGMLKVAKAKGIYQNFICEYIDERELDIKADTYDVVTISGGCTNNHLPCSCLKEIIRLVKPGGYFVMVTLPSHLNTVDEYKGRFEPLIDSLERERKWEKVRKDIVPHYVGDKDGVVFVYQIL